MTTQTAEEVIPRQKEGGRTGASSKKECATRHDAIILFNEARLRLLDVNRWHGLCGRGAEFQVTAAEGSDLNVKEVREGHLIRISLPAPENKSGEGYDWVRVEEIVQRRNMIKDEEVFGFRVRPVSSPLNTAEEPAHFYDKDATSTFLVSRSTNIVTVMEQGRNEVPNTAPRRLISRLRNLVVALGAMIGFSASQWKCLVNGILHGPEDKGD